VTEEAAPYDYIADGYRRWWAPVLVRDAVATLDLVAADVARGARRILDLGTGTGTLAIAALQRWPDVEVVGLDVSSEMIAVAEEEAQTRLDPDGRRRLTTVVADAEDLPFDARAFDLVVTSFVIQLVADRARALREVFRVLRPGGRIAYVTWLAGDVRFAPDAEFDAVLDELRLEGRDRGGGSPDVASPRAAADGLRRAGFRDVQASRSVLEHPFTPEAYLGFVEEFDEEELFDRLPRAQRDRLAGRLLDRLGRLAPGELVLRLPIVRATGVVPERPRGLFRRGLEGAGARMR
jgi:demethylmenaquinone methyltransferase/2-methoxy-6-polyprenyl-1,4-benzoquinol methylase